jgi:hypothetical protein
MREFIIEYEFFRFLVAVALEGEIPAGAIDERLPARPRPQPDTRMPGLIVAETVIERI